MYVAYILTQITTMCQYTLYISDKIVCESVCECVCVCV
jgi:hypothetical protein